MKVGDRITFKKLRQLGYSQCPVKGRDFSYWFSQAEGQWLKVVDGVIVRVFTE